MDAYFFKEKLTSDFINLSKCLQNGISNDNIN